MADAVRVDLKGALEGRHLMVDPDEVTLGLLEDIQAPGWKMTIDALAGCIVGGDLPRGTDRDGLRRLTLPGYNAVVDGVISVTNIPKN